MRKPVAEEMKRNPPIQSTRLSICFKVASGRLILMNNGMQTSPMPQKGSMM
jgi:hypothetical protein